MFGRFSLYSGARRSARIAEAMRVSEPYAAFVRCDRRPPHPRHWRALAELVGVKADEGFSKGKDTVG